MALSSSVRAARWVLPALCMLLVGAGGCLCGGDGVNDGDVNLISLDEEWQMGQQLARRVNREMTVVDGPARAYVRQMGKPLAEATALSDRPWTFHVVDSDEVNAFSLPGGHIFVHTGLIEAASSPSELAGVLAHEVAHGAARHSTERLTEAYGIDALIGLVTDGGGGVMQQLLTRLGRRGAIATFSRDDEREADRLGIEYLRAADYDPRGLVRFFETLQERQQRRPNALEQFFASHPLTEERLQDARQQIEAASAGSSGPAPAADVQRFRQIQQRLSQ